MYNKTKNVCSRQAWFSSKKQPRLLEPQNWVYTNKAQLYFIVEEKAIVRGVETNEHMNGMQNNIALVGFTLGVLFCFFYPISVLLYFHSSRWCGVTRLDNETEYRVGLLYTFLKRDG